MRIQTLYESLYKDDFEVISATLFSDNGDTVNGSFLLLDERTDVQYLIDLTIDKNTKKYKIESIVGRDGDNDFDGDSEDYRTVMDYLNNNVGYVLDYILKSQ